MRYANPKASKPLKFTKFIYDEIKCFDHVKTVLTVDDSFVIHKMLKKFFANTDFKIVANAYDSQEAVKLFFEYEPDLVTLDITMPNGNGLIALQKIISRNPEAKVLMLTSHGEESLIMDAITIGAKGYILKPLTKDKFYDQIKKLFPEYQE